MKTSFKYFLIFILINLISIDLYSQVCNTLDPCYDRCMLGQTCNIDDPIPLDEGVVFLLAAGLAFGLWKMRSGIQLASKSLK